MMGLIDLTVSLGNIITAIVTIGTVIIAAWRFTLVVARLETLYEMKIDLLWRDYCNRHGMNGTSAKKKE